MRTLAYVLSLGNFNLGTLAWDLSFGIFRLGTFAWDPFVFLDFSAGELQWYVSLEELQLGGWGTSKSLLGEPGCQL